jgi:hypothetical protein
MSDGTTHVEDEDIVTTWRPDGTSPRPSPTATVADPQDTDGTDTSDGVDGDGTDGVDGDSGDTDGTDSGDTDGTDSGGMGDDADGTDR